ncbi:MAG: hypothetical protein RIQ79_1307 [Verrucomicrobiota bacterium]
MKLLPLLLIGSLAANAVLLVPVVRRTSPSTASSAHAQGGASTAAPQALRASTTTRPAGPATGEGRAIAEAIRGDDLEALRDELRAAGLSDDVVRSIVSTRLWKRHEAQFKALQTRGEADAAWWKQQNGPWGGQTKEQREQMKTLQADLKAESERLLGPDPDRNANKNPWLERQYGFLPTEKRDSLQKLEQDYNELSGELQQETQGFQTPADREKARFIAAEKRRDLAALLTPEELKDYELRNSQTAQQLRWRMTQMDATEQEYRTVFDLQKQFDDVFNDGDAFGGRSRSKNNEDWKLRQDAEKILRDQLKTALGEDRYQAYQLAQNYEYQQLQAAVKRFNLPADTTARTYALRKEVPTAATKILDDPQMPVADKKTALAALANSTRDQLRTTLGAVVADTFLANGGMNWITQLEQGTVVTFNEDGGESHRRVDSPPPRPKKP